MSVPKILIALILCVLASSARAEVGEVVIARQPSLGHLPLMIMEDRKLLEKNAAARGIPDLKVKYLTFAGGSVMNDTLLAGTIQFAAGGVPPLVLLWAKTRGTPRAVKAVAAMNAMPLFLNTSRPDVHALKDLTENDRIALPAVKMSIQAIFLQMAAEKELGRGHHGDLDHLTVTLSHPDGMRALLSKTEVSGHFTAAPTQELELAHSGIHRLLSSYDVLGSPSTFNVVWTTTTFHDANPRIYEAFVVSLEEAVSLINANPADAAKTYVKMSGDAAGESMIASILSDPEVSFSTTPQNIGAFVDFMSRTGLIHETAGTWKDLFFSNMQNKNGS